MSFLPPLPLDVALIGAGRVGTAVAALLAERGQRIVGVASRTRSSAHGSAGRLATEVFDLDSPVAADLYVIGTGSAAIASVTEQLAATAELAGRVVVHLSGSDGIEPLSAARAGGAHVCALHPVQACPDVEAGIRNLPGSTWGVTTSEGAGKWAADLVRLLNGDPVAVAEADRVAWHAAAVVTSNGIAALLAAGEQILAGLQITDPVSVLSPLAKGTVANATLGGGGAATLTGPVVRGEFDIVREHAAALEEVDTELRDLYMLVTKLIARVAIGSGRLIRSDADRLEKSLKDLR